MDSLKAQDIKDYILQFNHFTEIPEKKRTPEQSKLLEDAENFLRDNALDAFDVLAKPIFDEIRFMVEVEEGKHLFTRWDSALQDAATFPPRMPFSTPNQGEFDKMFREIYTGQNTVGGLYEEVRALRENFDRAMDHAEKICIALWNYEKPTKAKAVFEALIPDDVARYVRRIAEFTERAHKRFMAFEAAFNTLVQLKNLNLGTPNSPTRLYETQEQAPAQSPQSRFAGASSPRARAKPTIAA